MDGKKAVIARQLALNPLKNVAAAIYKIDECHEYISNEAGKQITKELTGLCTKSQPSLLRQREKKQLTTFNWDAVNNELKERCPLFHKFLTASVSNPSQARNVHKKNEAILSPMLDAGCQLITTFNSDLDVTRRLKSLVLKKGGLKKVGFKRLSALNLCLSYNATSTMMEKLGEGFDDKLLEWKKEVEKGVKKEKEILESLDKATAEGRTDVVEECSSSLEAHQKTMHPGYSFTGDNVDINCSPRQMTLQNRNKDHHLFQLVAFKNRVPSNHLPSNIPSSDICKIPFSSILPSPDEQTTLKEELVVLVGLKWAHYIPALSWLEEHLPPFIPHQNTDMTQVKSEKVCQLKFHKKKLLSNQF